MLDFRPIAYFIGLTSIALGLAMLVPMLVDLYADDPHWMIFLECAMITCLSGMIIALTTTGPTNISLSRQQSFFLTTGVWAVLPLFAALPFILGAPQSSLVDGLFEAMSGLTTTGSTIYADVETLPLGLKLWRAMTQWIGGIGIIIMAMVFLPELQVGGMQIFRAEGFDATEKILPRVAQIATRILGIYVTLTLSCGAVYALLGMKSFDAVTHAMTTIATGGFANYNNSFGAFPAVISYAAVIFMILAALPFARYVQLVGGKARPLLSDPQIRGFLTLILVLSLFLVLWLVWKSERPLDAALRHATFNAISLITGTGYASEDYGSWGGFALIILFFAGLIGGCAGSTSCSVKVFRYQLLLASLRSQILKMRWPSGTFPYRYNGKRIGTDVLNSVAVFFILFLTTLLGLALLLSLSGLDFITALSGAATALANVGPGLGGEIGPAGHFGGLNVTAKWLLIGGMLIGRLELLAVFVMFTRQFWYG